MLYSTQMRTILALLIVSSACLAADPERTAEIANLQREISNLRIQRQQVQNQPISVDRAQAREHIDQAISSKQAVIDAKQKASK